MFFDSEEHCKIIIAALVRKLGGSVMITQEDFTAETGKSIETDLDPVNGRVIISVTDCTDMIGEHTVQ